MEKYINQSALLRLSVTFRISREILSLSMKLRKFMIPSANKTYTAVMV